MTFQLAEVRMKAGSRLPHLRMPLTYSDGTPINLSDATGATFKMRERDALVNATLTGIGSIVDGPTGMVQWTWGLNDTNVPIGPTGIACYIGEWEVMFPGSMLLEDPGENFVVLYFTAGI